MTAHLLKDFQLDEKPREKTVKNGVGTLTDTELLALLLRSGGKEESVIELARNILNKFNNFNGLLECDLNDLINFKNVGLAKATAIKAACEVALRIKSTNSIKPYVKSPEDIKKLLNKDLYGKTNENLYLISLDSRNRLIAKDLIFVGTATESVVHPREIYKKALARNAVSIILAHNHPSNDSNPSLEDIKVTKQLAEAGQQMGIPLLDHIIFCNNSFSSMKALQVFSTYKFKEKGGEINEQN
jgi:DNA repair protein RadC